MKIRKVIVTTLIITLFSVIVSMILGTYICSLKDAIECIPPSILLGVTVGLFYNIECPE